jgi:hypothetical protein
MMIEKAEPDMENGGGVVTFKGECINCGKPIRVAVNIQ